MAHNLEIGMSKVKVPAGSVVGKGLLFASQMVPCELHLPVAEGERASWLDTVASTPRAKGAVLTESPLNTSSLQTFTLASNFQHWDLGGTCSNLCT